MGRRSQPPGAAALAALPLAGAVLGAAAGSAGTLASRFLPAPFGGIVAFGALAGLTGAIHLDGFLDGCDALFASVPPERRREILKDPRHGTFAVAGMFCVASAAVAALSALPPRRLPATLAFSAALARAASVSGAFVFPAATARDGTHYARSRSVAVVLSGTFAALALGGGVLVDRRAVWCVPVALAGVLACERWICGRLGGLVGDAYGFTIVVTEVATLVALTARTSRAPGWRAGRSGDGE